METLTEKQITAIINNNREYKRNTYYNRRTKTFEALESKETKGLSGKWNNAKLNQNLVLALQFKTGLRINEIANLTKENLQELNINGKTKIDLSKSTKRDARGRIIKKYREIEIDLKADFTKRIIKPLLNAKIKAIESGETLIRQVKDERVVSVQKKYNVETLSIFMTRNDINQNLDSLLAFIKSLESKNVRTKYTLKKFNKDGEATDIDGSLIDFNSLNSYGIQRSIRTTKIVNPSISSFTMTFNQMLKKAVKELAELDNINRLKSHDLRRNFIAESMNKLNDLELVREVVKHSDTNTTKKYIEGSKNIFKEVSKQKSSKPRPTSITKLNP